MSLASPADAVDYDATLIMAVEIINKSWVVAAWIWAYQGQADDWPDGRSARDFD